MNDNTNLLVFVLLAILIARTSTLLKKIGQPSLLGELLGGILIVTLGVYHISIFHNFATNHSIAFLSELGGIFLLFEIGLESDISLLKQNGHYALWLALFGALLPFIAGYAFAQYFVINASRNFCLFFAATLSATSTGISIRIFKEYNLTRSKACQVVLASSVIDDILSLLVLTCITAVVTTGKIGVSNLMFLPIKVMGFFLLLYFGMKSILPRFYYSRDTSLDLTIIIASCLISSWLANLVGLSSILGAFLAGLFIDKTYFKDKHHLVYPFIWLFVPIFFIYSGMQIDIQSLFDIQTLLFALLFSLIAIITKILPPLLIPNKHTSFLNKLAIGLGMVPRGEIGLIIALIGKEIGVLNSYYFNVITIMVIITSFISPILLNLVIKKIKE